MLNVMNKAAQYKICGNRSQTFGTFTNKITDSMNESQRKIRKVGGRNEFARGKEERSNRVPPSHYICNRCNKSGHFVRFCPTNGNSDFDPKAPKHATGIPRSFLRPISPGDCQDIEDEERYDKVVIDIEKNGQKVSEFFLAQPNTHEFQRFYGTNDMRRDRGIKRLSQAES